MVHPAIKESRQGIHRKVSYSLNNYTDDTETCLQFNHTHNIVVI